MWVIAGRKTAAGGWAQRWSPPARGEVVGVGRRKPSCKALRSKVVIYWTCRRQRGRCPGCLGRWSCHSQEERYKRRARPEAWLTFLLPQTALFFFPNIPPSLFLLGICKGCVPSLFVHHRGLSSRAFPEWSLLRSQVLASTSFPPRFPRPHAGQAPADCSLALCSLCSPAL